MSTLPRFDGCAAWAQLPPEEQAKIGALALELVAAWACNDEVDETTELPEAYARAAGLCDAELISALQETVVDALPRDVFFEGDLARIPSHLGPICRVCGCTQHDGCECGCGWAADDLCTSCADGRHVFVSADRRGVISIASTAPEGDLVLIDGPEAALRELVNAEARHGYTAGALLVPGIPEAESDDAALDALIVFRDRLRVALPHYLGKAGSEVAP